MFIYLFLHFMFSYIHFIARTSRQPDGSVLRLAKLAAVSLQ